MEPKHSKPWILLLIRLFTGYFLLCAVFAAIAHIISFFDVSIVPDVLALILSISMLVSGIVCAFGVKRFFPFVNDFKEAVPLHTGITLRLIIPVILLGYAVLVFLVILLMKSTGVEPGNNQQGRAWAVYLFSAYWMLFHYMWFSVGLVTYRALRKNT